MEIRQRRRTNQDSTFEYKPEKKSNPAVTTTFYLFLFAILGALVIVVAYYMSPIRPESLGWVKRVALDGKLKVNNRLANGKTFELDGPECIVEDDNKNIYTGLSNGKIMKIHPGHNDKIGEGYQEVFFYSKFPGAAKTDPNAEHGRPLGMRIRDNKLFVMDAVYGLYSIDLSNKQVQFVIKVNDVTPNLVFPDDFDITKDGHVFYFTDATSRFHVNRGAYAILEGKCTGRVFRYDHESKVIQLMKDGLCFANGIQLNKMETTVVVCESVARRVVYLDTTSWITKYKVHLPTMCDNIRMNKRGNYWIASTLMHNEDLDRYEHDPSALQLMAGVVPYSTILSKMDVTHSIVFEVSPKAKILQVLHDEKGVSTRGISHCSDLSDGRIVTGSFGGKMSVHEYEDPPPWMLKL